LKGPREVNYFAHTARESDGTPDANPAHWQLLSSHLGSVAELERKGFAAPLDLCKYAERPDVPVSAACTDGVSRRCTVVPRETAPRSTGAVNRHHVLWNWLIGADLVEFEQIGEDRAQYGEQLLPHLAKDLTGHEVPGCSREMSSRVRVLFRMYPQIEAAIRSSVMTESLGLLPVPFQIRSSVMTECAVPRANEPRPPRPPPELVLRISWTHLIELIRIEDLWKRAFYENECLRGNWSGFAGNLVGRSADN